jgi:hypothetical protein
MFVAVMDSSVLTNSFLGNAALNLLRLPPDVLLNVKEKFASFKLAWGSIGKCENG